MVHKKLSPEEAEEDAKIINRVVSDLKKKKMKKSASIKHAKNPPCTAATPPQKHHRPNYMKPTTSSDARKPPTPAKAPDIVSSTMQRRKLALASASKGAKTSSSSSMKMRSLTKIPSFKPARSMNSARKCSAAVVLCEDSDAKRATCSSTLKHCKFPAYLSLDHGGTEAEGTSSIKVCPYTYCSLNGHHHREPLPPLKLFLSARRRAAKVQRSVKTGCLSPRRAKGTNEMEEGLRAASPVEDFFVEIYGVRNEDGGDFYSHEGDESCNLLQEDQQEVLICDEDGVGEVLDGDGSIMSLMEVEVDGEISTTSVLDQEERSDLVGLSGLLLVENSVPNVDDSNESDCEASSYEVEYLYGTKVEPDPDLGEAEIEGFVIKSENKDGCFDEFLVDEVSYDEQSLDSDAFYNSDCDGESTASSHLRSSNHGLGEEEITSFDSLKHNPSEDGIAAVEDQDEAITSAEEGCKIQTELSEEIHHQISHNNNSTTLISPTDPVKEPQNGWSTFKKAINEDDDEFGLFDPRGPNFLPLEPKPDGEKVDLRHQDLDERKNAEEWMVDYALRQVVTKLGPARKKKVALLVEAFEKVMPETKWGFDQPRPIQACS